MACNPQDIVGKKFTRWTVLSVCAEKDKYGFYNYECICECGNTKIITRSSLNSGKSQSCGCLNKELTSVRTKELHKNADVRDMIGKVFGKLTVIKRYDQVNSDNKYPYVCKCECGGEVIAAKNNLVGGRTQSCGCLHHDSLIERHQEYRDSFDHQSFIGKVFGKLTIIEYNGYINSSYGQAFACQCECGKIKNYSLYHIESGQVKSCGCLIKEKCPNPIIYSEDIKERKRFWASSIRQNALIRDNFKCFICKKNNEPLEVHHIESWSEKPELRFKITNLISLCEVCHFYHAHSNNCNEINIEWKKKFMDYTFSFDLVEI